MKNRRGDLTSAYSIRLSNGRFRIIPKEVYENLKQIQEKKNFTDSDIDAKIKTYHQFVGAENIYSQSNSSGVVSMPNNTQFESEPKNPEMPRGRMPF